MLARAMPQHVQGSCRRRRGRPVSVETVVIPDPGPGEAIVQIQACGVCHTDLHYREGGISDDFPFLLGHEAAGIVETVGDGVTDVAPATTWSSTGGRCAATAAVAAGKPWYCFKTHNATQKMTLADGTELSPALGIGAFIDKTLVAAGQCTKVDRGPGDRCRPARVWCDGRPRAAMNTGGVARGDTVAVFGCGGVGDAAIAGARLAGAATIIAVDIDDRKLEWPRTSARPTRSTRRAPMRSSTSGRSPTASVPTCASRPSANPAVYQQAFAARDLAGTVVLVGVPTPDITLELPFIEVFGRGGALKSSWYGDCLPSATSRC